MMSSVRTGFIAGSAKEAADDRDVHQVGNADPILAFALTDKSADDQRVTVLNHRGRFRVLGIERWVFVLSNRHIVTASH